MHRQGQKYRKKHETKRFVEFHNHLYALTMPKLSVIHIGFILEGRPHHSHVNNLSIVTK